MNRQGSLGSIISAFAIGGLIGVGLTLLMAPQSGEKTRTMILDKSSDLKGRAVGTVEDTRDKAGKAIDDLSNGAKNTVSNLSNRSQDLVNERISKIEERVDDLKKSICN